MTTINLEKGIYYLLRDSEGKVVDKTSRKGAAINLVRFYRRTYKIYCTIEKVIEKRNDEKDKK